MTFGENVKAMRERQGLSQSELANKMNITQQAIAKYEKAIDTPKLATVRKIAAALGVYVSELEPDWGSFTTEEYISVWEDNEPSESNNESIKESSHLLRSYEKLNDTGKNKVIEYAKDLTEIPKYQKKDE